MNILFFLTPKSKVAYIYDDYTLRQTLEKMEHHRYSAVPILTRSGAYLGTITEGDLLWAIKNKYSLNFKEAESLSIMEVSRRMDNEPVSAETEIEDLLSKAMNQNFVPVTDDRGIFIGIITRKDIMRYFSQKLYVEAPKPLPLSDYQMRSASR
ncbi:CBS domain-containing protein [Acidaminobacterium chupaoyuni]